MMCESTYVPDTLIRLDQFVNGPKDPTDRVEKPVEPGPGDLVHDHCQEDDVNYVHSARRSRNIGLGAAVLRLLPFGIKGHYNGFLKKNFEIEKLKSKSLEPSDGILYLKSKNYKKSII